MVVKKKGFGSSYCLADISNQIQTNFKERIRFRNDFLRFDSVMKLSLIKDNHELGVEFIETKQDQFACKK